MRQFRAGLFAMSMLALCLTSVRGQEDEESPKKNKMQAFSPDGRFAFRYSGDPDSAGAEDAEKQTYDLIDKKSGKVLMSVVESDPDLGPSARFQMHVLWRPDSKAFAITAFLWKRGSTLFVCMRDGSAFRKIEIPELEADIPDKEKKGKAFPHVVELNSETAKRWQKDGSLMVEIQSTQDGEGDTITATRKVVLGFDRSDKAKILKSTTKYAIEKQ